MYTVAGGERNLEFDDFVPDRIGALMIRYGQKFLQTAPRILRGRFHSCRFGGCRIRGRGVRRNRISGLLFTHEADYRPNPSRRAI